MEKSKIIEKLFEHINTYAYLILPVLFFLTKTKKRDGKILAIYGVVFCSLLFFYYYIPKQFIKTAYQPLYTFLEYFFFAIIYYNNTENRKFKRIIVGLSALFFMFQILYVLFIEKGRVDSVVIGVESILIFIYIILFFFENLNNTKGINIYSNHCFWISIGLLFYLGGSFFLNILANTLSDEDFKKYWFLNFIADTIKTLLFAIGLLILAYKTKKKTIHNPTSVPNLEMI